MKQKPATRADFHIVIPARLESTRLPEKALADVCGKPLVVRVLERAWKSRAGSTHVATDSPRIAEVVREAGGQVLLTRPEHASGTERLAEAVDQLGLDDDAIMVNLQGDEPAVPPACLAQVAELLAADPAADMATLWMPIESVDDWRNPGVVKLVTDARGYALYFSRAPIPHARDGGWPGETARRHVGLYAYRAGRLRQWQALPVSRLEQLESLEQLRALEAGWTIACARALEPVPAGVDTPEDLEKMRKLFKHRE